VQGSSGLFNPANKKKREKRKKEKREKKNPIKLVYR